jgi:hypothetical protein
VDDALWEALNEKRLETAGRKYLCTEHRIHDNIIHDNLIGEG